MSYPNPYGAGPDNSGYGMPSPQTPAPWGAAYTPPQPNRPHGWMVATIGLALTLTMSLIGIILLVKSNNDKGDTVSSLQQQVNQSQKADQDLRAAFKQEDFGRLYRDILTADENVEKKWGVYANTPDNSSEEDLAWTDFKSTRLACRQKVASYLTQTAKYPHSYFSTDVPQFVDPSNGKTDCDSPIS
jgi:hypothetical protein